LDPASGYLLLGVSLEDFCLLRVRMMMTVVLVAALVAVFLLAMLLTRWRLGRATRGVTDSFIQHDAIGPGKAMSADELGLARRRYSFTRDYRQIAFTGLLQGGAIGQTDDGKYYLTDQYYRNYMAHKLRSGTGSRTPP